MAGRKWDEVFLGQHRYEKGRNTPKFQGPSPIQSVFDMPAIRRQAAKLEDPMLSEEIELAIAGDDEFLLPYQPTSTINPGRPRTLAAGYDERTMALRIKFRNGEYYTYYNVPPSVWFKFQRAQSPGRFINVYLNRYPYSRGLF